MKIHKLSAENSSILENVILGSSALYRDVSDIDDIGMAKIDNIRLGDYVEFAISSGSVVLLYLNSITEVFQEGRYCLYSFVYRRIQQNTIVINHSPGSKTTINNYY